MNVATAVFATLAMSLSVTFSINAQASTYNFDFLTAPDSISGTARSINDSGTVVGSVYSTRVNPYNPRNEPLVWNNSESIGLWPLTTASAVNNSGQIAGNLTLDYYPRAALFSDGVAQNLGTLGGNFSEARSLNNLGHVVGYSGLAGFGMHAFLWNGTELIDLGTLGGYFSAAYDINDRGQIVGSSRPSLNTCCNDHATLWESSGIIDLGALAGPGWDSTARAINNSGKVVGYSQVEDRNYHAFSWEDGVMTDLGTLGGKGSAAYDVNDHGDVVGYSTKDAGSVGYAALWRGNLLVDLNDFLDAKLIQDGWALASAEGINNEGSIVGTAVNGRLKMQVAYVLTPTTVPEPTTIVLFLTAFALLIVRQTRRQP